MNLLINCLHSVSINIIYGNSNVWKSKLCCEYGFHYRPSCECMKFSMRIKQKKTPNKQTHHSTTHHVNIVIYLYLYESLYLRAVFGCLTVLNVFEEHDAIGYLAVLFAISRCMFKFCLIKRIETLLNSM